MYHQFKQLADIDITAVPMEVGPTTHYIMGGIRVDGDSQMSTVPGCSRRASARRACTARTGWAATRCRPAGVRQAAGEYAAKFAKERGAVAIDEAQIASASRARWRHSNAARRPPDAEGPYKIQYELQDVMQDNVGIVRNEADMKKAPGRDPRV
jgi:succinate dehydrogenase / fumarate reductase flavoprotein subunit